MTCYECGNPATEKHHMVPKSLGGTKTIDLCSACHCKIHGFEGNRIKAVELSKLGVYRKNPVSFVSVMAWNKFDVKGRWLIGGKPATLNQSRDADYSSYQKFSGDYKLSKSQFENRCEVIVDWFWKKKYDWMYDVVSSHGNHAKLIGLRTMYDRFNIKRYNHQYKSLLKSFNEWAGNYYVGTQYEKYVLQNVLQNLEDRESRWIIKRQQSEHELLFLAKKEQEENERLAESRLQKTIGRLFAGIRI